MIEERGSENELRFAKPSFAARPMRLDPSHFYHPGLATTDESRIGCGGMNERGAMSGGEEGGPEGQERQSVVSGPSCAPSHGPSRLPARLALPSPHQPAGSFELAAFCGVQPPRDSERRTQRPRRALTQPPFLGCRKRYLTSWPAVLLVPCRHHPCERAHQPHRRVLPSQPQVRPSQPLAEPRRPPPPPAADTKDFTREPRACIDHARKLHRCALSVTSGERGKSLGGCFQNSRNFPRSTVAGVTQQMRYHYGRDRRRRNDSQQDSLT